MIYKIRILKNASRDLDWFRKHDRINYIKCFDLTREIIETPRTGLGKLERLKYFEEEVYSRRINHKDRMIYTIYENIKEIDVSSFRGHYH
uniref:Toxin YoeB n=1 Tax=Candidatus Kentrum sp. TUN TaxID=2126343 RepID=A0A450ZN87_9GAMM|nr:MAG: toxin YoeB [Candidatus Kentron sp. TUN]VFK55269.1 MAG: toxin YoeB [Candidatus Kentron sp. TUN]VFK55438.1 MAG: toxin YoeB [Candidatus Kentron sp. TUN]